MEPTVLLAGLVGLLALSAKVIDFLRLVADLARDGNPTTLGRVLTQLAAWVGGVAVVFLYGASDFGVTVDLGGISLADVNGWSKVLVGLVVGSAASLAKDYIAARDNSDSSKMPPLLGP